MQVQFWWTSGVSTWIDCYIGTDCLCFSLNPPGQCARIIIYLYIPLKNTYALQQVIFQWCNNYQEVSNKLKHQYRFIIEKVNNNAWQLVKNNNNNNAWF